MNRTSAFFRYFTNPPSPTTHTSPSWSSIARRYRFSLLCSSSTSPDQWFSSTTPLSTSKN